MTNVLIRSVLLATLTGCAAARTASLPGTTDTFRIDLAVSGDGAPHYRIPALTVTERGTLLAAYDARPTLGDLPSNIAIMLRRSFDNGRTWSAPIVVRRDTAPIGFGDPSLLVDRETKRVFLFHAAGVRQGFSGSHVGNNEQDDDVLQADISYSDDDGVTWRHRRITRQIKNSVWGGIFASSGEGIQLRRGPHAGRLVQQYVVRVDGKNWAASAYSDDHGATWQMGALVGPDADENKVVELADGRLMLNSRAKPQRRVAWSSDGGETWTGWRIEPQLIDPANNGAIARYAPNAFSNTPESHWLLFSNTEHTSERRNLTVKMSCDDGITWPIRIVVDSGRTAYSTITRLRDGALGVLYERGDYQAITFGKVPVPRSCEATGASVR